MPSQLPQEVPRRALIRLLYRARRRAPVAPAQPPGSIGCPDAQPNRDRGQQRGAERVGCRLPASHSTLSVSRPRQCAGGSPRTSPLPPEARVVTMSGPVQQVSWGSARTWRARDGPARKEQQHGKAVVPAAEGGPRLQDQRNPQRHQTPQARASSRITTAEQEGQQTKIKNEGQRPRSKVTSNQSDTEVSGYREAGHSRRN